MPRKLKVGDRLLMIQDMGEGCYKRGIEAVVTNVSLETAALKLSNCVHTWHALPHTYLERYSLLIPTGPGVSLWKDLIL